ncbi:MAG: carboxypeptidase regulatory-like domain-containing protein [Deltaproteobacteria bacterium]|nr:MAG: carboxypeptidase regulatory-like domain-containing protein [Deltaproteobacteria bacterium]
MHRLLPILLVACTASEPEETGTPEETGMPTWDSRVEGRVEDASGNPLAGLRVTLCASVCIVQESDADGQFVFRGAWPEVNVLETSNYPGEDQSTAVLAWSRGFDLVAIGEDEHIVLDEPLVVQQVSTQAELTGLQDLSFGDLRVQFDADAVMAAGLPYPAETLALGATEIPEAQWPRGVGEWTIHKAWALAVWDLRLDDGFAASATLDSPVAADREVAFLVADYTHGFREGSFFIEPAELSSDGLTLSTPVDGGIDRTTLWIAASRPVQ